MFFKENPYRISQSFEYGAPDLVTATFVQRNYRAEKLTFFLSVW